MGRGIGSGGGKGGGKGYGSGDGAGGAFSGYGGRSSTSVATVGNTSVVITVQTPAQEKSIVEAYVLCLVLGLIGGHHFYLGRIGFGFLYLFTFGLFGFGVLGDLIRMPFLVKDVNYKLKNPQFAEEKSLADAYVLWFNPFGFFGFHHFYLKNYGLGILYLLTIGVFGIGWLVDAFRIPSLVREVNGVTRGDIRQERNVCTVYVCALSPLGVLGLHHYYLQRPRWGLLYTFTLGLLGVGWICDWLRIPFLVARFNQRNELVNGVKKDERKYLDDAYILLIPWGIAGFHHFYLRRYGWGVIYLFTFGLMGIGWLVDIIRLPKLVEAYNQTQEERQRIISTVAHEMVGQAASVTVTSGNVPIATHAHGGAYPGMIISPPQAQPGIPYYQQQVGYPPQQSWHSGGQAMGYQAPAGYHQQIGVHGGAAQYAHSPIQQQMMQPPTYDEIMAQNNVTSGASADNKPTVQTTADI